MDILPNILLQALTFGIGAIGVAIAFRVTRYPDLTADGSFMLGSAAFAWATSTTGNWILAVTLSITAGALAGLTTSLLNTWFRVSRLLSGILTTMIAYSLVFRLLDGHSNVGVAVERTMFAPPPGPAIDLGSSVSVYSLAVAALFGLVVMLFVRHVLKSELGLILRTTGSNAELVTSTGRSPAVYRAIGLSLANGLVGLSGALVSAQQGFVDVNLGVGVVITLVASLVLGEELFKLFGQGPRTTTLTRSVAPVVGTAIYFLLYLFVLRASIRGWIPIAVEPTDLKLLSAALLILVIAFRRGGSRREEELPL